MKENNSSVYRLYYKSNENCKYNETKKFKLTITGVCKNESVGWSTDYEGGCQANLRYTGQVACEI